MGVDVMPKPNRFGSPYQYPAPRKEDIPKPREDEIRDRGGNLTISWDTDTKAATSDFWKSLLGSPNPHRDGVPLGAPHHLIERLTNATVQRIAVEAEQARLEEKRREEGARMNKTYGEAW